MSHLTVKGIHLNCYCHDGKCNDTCHGCSASRLHWVEYFFIAFPFIVAVSQYTFIHVHSTDNLFPQNAIISFVLSLLLILTHCAYLMNLFCYPYRATSEEESLHLLEAGATQTVSDERESAFRAAQVLVKDILASSDSSSSFDDLIFEVRSREESLANDKLEMMMLKKAGVVNMLRNERFSRSDTTGSNSMGRAANFMDKMGIADFLGDKFAPMKDGNPFYFMKNNDNEENNSIESQEGMTVVAVTESGNSPPTSPSPELPLQLADDPLVDAAMGEEELGVLICAMPPRKSKTSSDSNKP